MTCDALRRGRISQHGRCSSVTTVACHRIPWVFNLACARAAILELHCTASVHSTTLFPPRRGSIIVSKEVDSCSSHHRQYG